MDGSTYLERRGAIRTYFDRTAVDAWKRFASDAPLGRIRETVRQGRAEMRAAILSTLPADLTGWRILDAGCGTGAMSVELARRGARVLGVDLAPEIIHFAEQTLPEDLRNGQIRFEAGDMLAAAAGGFDAVVAMDSLIHYEIGDALDAVSRLSHGTTRRMTVTFAPRTPLLGAMHSVGRLFPKSDRAPSIVPVPVSRMMEAAQDRLGAAGWCVGATRRVSRGFYTSQMLELVRR